MPTMRSEVDLKWVAFENFRNEEVCLFYLSCSDVFKPSEGCGWIS